MGHPFLRDVTMPKTDPVTLAVLGAKMDSMQEKLDAVHHTVCGNGQPGLKVEVALLKQRQRIRDWIYGTVLVPLALTVLGWALSLLF